MVIFKQKYLSFWGSVPTGVLPLGSTVGLPSLVPHIPWQNPRSALQGSFYATPSKMYSMLATMCSLRESQFGRAKLLNGLCSGYNWLWLYLLIRR